MGGFQGCLGKAFQIHRIGVVLGGDFHLAAEQIFDRMVAAPMAELQLIGAGAIGKCQNLMTQADTENGVFSPKLTDKLSHTGHILRVSGAVGEEYSIRGQGFHLLGSGVPGQDSYVTAPVVELADNVPLHAAVNGGNVIFRAPLPEKTRPWGC